jgi:hypothetical protein
MKEQIIKAVDDTINALRSTFEKKPTLFYTERDLVCWFTEDLNRRLGRLKEAADSSGLLHRLVHTEYPTPMRCSMADGDCRVMQETDRTENKRRYRRGHLDIVVLNPAFIQHHDYKALKAQHYDHYKHYVLPQSQGLEPMMLFAVEFFLARDEIKPSNGTDKALAARKCAQAIRQDADKLVAAR